MNGKIYMIRNEVNGKRYIGQTVNSLEERFKQHKQGTRQPKKNMTKLQKAMDKYGKPMFTITLIEENIDTIELLAEREKFFIEKFNTKEEYNSTNGGENKLRTKTVKNDSDLVIIHNDFNKISFPTLTRKELDFLYGMITFLRNKGSETVKISFDTLLPLVEMTFFDKTKADLGKWLDKFFNKVNKSICPTLMIDLDMCDKFTEIPFFGSARCNLDENYIEFSLNKKLGYIVNKTRNKTMMVLSFNKFKSFNRKYDKRLYTLLSQCKKEGLLTVNIDEFKRLMDIPDNYRPTKIKQFIIDPAMLELSNTFSGLKHKVEKTKGRVTGYTFTWDGEYFSRRQNEEVNEKVQRRVNAAMKRTEKKSVKAMVNDELSQRKEPINTITQEEVDSILSLYFNKNEESFG